MRQTERDRSSVLRAARERTRAEITREILDAARLVRVELRLRHPPVARPLGPR